MPSYPTIVLGIDYISQYTFSVCVVLLVLLAVFMRKQIQEYVRAVTTKLQITEPKSAIKVQTLEADQAKENEQMTDEKRFQD